MSLVENVADAEHASKTVQSLHRRFLREELELAATSPSQAPAGVEADTGNPVSAAGVEAAQQGQDALPCPFCGAVGLEFGQGSTFRWITAECAGCGATTGETRIQTFGEGTREEWLTDARQDAIKAWNTRAATSAKSHPQEGRMP
jgi:Lar family restriction alleviation protein